MGDDFDLFPKRENLDPFSFKTREKKTEPQEDSEDLFGLGDQPSPPVPDEPTEPPPEGEPETGDPGPSGVRPPLEPSNDSGIQRETEMVPEPEGPISDSKTFDEPYDEIMKPSEETGTRKRKTSSPFIVVGGALIIIIGLLYLALTFLKRDRPPVPTISVPEASVPVEPQAPAMVPVPTPAKPEEEPPVEAPTAPEPAPEVVVQPGPPEQQEPTDLPEIQKPEAPEPVQEEAETPASAAAGVDAMQGGNYSVQAGAFILQTSVLELEKRLSSLGYETFRKEGSTTTLMNMVTVGPFQSVEAAREAVSDFNEAGIESNLARLAEGGAVVNAGSYLLEENANNILKKIRDMGYPVTLTRKEARLPMTFVRVGRFEGISEASSLRDELKEKGLDAIVVKLQ